MQFFSGSRIGTHQPSSHLLLRHKIIILVITLAGVCALSLVVHAAQVNSNSSSSSFGILSQTVTTEAQPSSTDGSSLPLNTSTTIDIQQSEANPVIPNESKTSLTINNESILVPDNGTVTKNMTSDNGQTSVQIQTSNQSTSTSKHNSLRIQSNARSTQSTITHSTQQINNEGELQP